MLSVFLISTIGLAAPLILAAVGGYFSERSGVIDIALEGKMLTAACLTAVVAASTHSALMGVVGGVAGAILLSILHWCFTQMYRIDHVVSGMALNAMAIGGTNFAAQKFADSSQEFPQLAKLHLGQTPISIYIVLAYILPWCVYVYAKQTRSGLHLVATGNDPYKARLVGLNPVKIRFGALVATGVFTGLAGVLIADNAGRFSDNMTSGRGYIALAALIIGNWRPIPAMAAAIAFGAFEAIEIALQGVKVFGHDVPPQFWQSLPYLAAVIALAGFLGKSRAPLALGRH